MTPTDSSPAPLTPPSPSRRPSRPKRLVHALLALLVIVFYALHQDVWNWREARPFVLGFIPVGLAYHAAYSVAAALLMALLVRCAWPSHLESAAPAEPIDGSTTPPGPAPAPTMGTAPETNPAAGRAEVRR